MVRTTQRRGYSQACVLIIAFSLLTMIASIPAVTSVQAADHYNLEEGLPVEIEDALATAYRNREVQGRFRWERNDAGEDRFLIEPRLEYGLWHNLQVELEVPFEWGEAVEEEGLGDVKLGVLYNFNQETLIIPAFALKVSADFPTNDASEGVDTTVKFIATKIIGWSTMFQRIHINAAWKHNDQPFKDERENYYMFAVGYDRRIGPDTLLILDFVREQDKKKKADFNILEAGIRYQLTPLTVLVAGIGAGIAEESPDFRTTLGFQHSF